MYHQNILLKIPFLLWGFSAGQDDFLRKQKTNIYFGIVDWLFFFNDKASFAVYRPFQESGLDETLIASPTKC